MSARIAPKSDTIGIAFSPHLPRFTRPAGRKTFDDTQEDLPAEAAPRPFGESLPAVEPDDSLPSATIFEAGLLGNEQALAPPSAYEYIQRLNREWSPPASTFPLTDKTI